MEKELASLVAVAVGQGLAIFLVIVTIWFLMFRLWPWFTKVYLPERRAHEMALTASQELIAQYLSDAAEALNEFALSISALCEQMSKFKPP